MEIGENGVSGRRVPPPVERVCENDVENVILQEPKEMGCIVLTTVVAVTKKRTATQESIVLHIEVY